MGEQRNNFDEVQFNLLCALNAFIQDDEVSKNTNWVIKANRFKVWVNSLSVGSEPTK